MKKWSSLFALAALLVSCAILLLGAALPKVPSMPAAVSSNAVASLKGGLQIFSLMGVGPRKTWDDITNQVYVLNLASQKWNLGRPVPGVAGRLGSSAIGVKGQIFLFGGYVVDAQGNENTVSDVNAYVPEGRRWYSGTDIPVAVDSAVLGINHERYIYLVGGRSKSGPVNNVQVYDIEKNSWSQATPFPGTPVFGHAGGLADDAIVFVNGAMKNPASGPPYIASEDCWVGKIDKKDPNKIQWSKLPTHPGPARFGIAGGAEGKKVYFSGGSIAPHNYKGIGYDGKPADVSTMTFEFDVHGNRWETVEEETADARMDNRGILSTPPGPIVLGGMVQNQTVTSRAMLLPKK
jgi:N-acetylneuraminic acid mutarotase